MYSSMNIFYCYLPSSLPLELLRPSSLPAPLPIPGGTIVTEPLSSSSYLVKNVTVLLGEVRFCCENGLLSILKRKGKRRHLYDIIIIILGKGTESSFPNRALRAQYTLHHTASEKNKPILGPNIIEVWYDITIFLFLLLPRGCTHNLL